MDLLDFVMRQGVPEDRAKELVEMKRKRPNLASVEVRGRMVSLCLPSPTDGMKFNEMLASGNGPYLKTDAMFMSGTANGSQFAHRPEAGEEYRMACERNGGSVLGRKYISQLARFPGDPEAWVSGRGDVQRICEQRGWGSEGAVNVAGRQIDGPVQSVAVAPDILAEAVNLQVKDKDLSQREIADVIEKTKDQLTPSWKKT